MPFNNQIEIPSSFIALYLTPGRDRPNAPREEILARYELCEDMEQKVLRQFHQALLAEPSNLSVQESVWVMRRLVELLDWAPPVFE